MNVAQLLLGTNVEDRKVFLEEACEHLTTKGVLIIKRSQIYETAPWGKTDQPSFLNQAITVDTERSGPMLMKLILEIEKEMGRIREEKWGQRIIDIDIVLFNSDVIEVDGLSVPHPRMTSRKFVLVPLAEICGDWKHPILQKTIEQLNMECNDELEVNLFVAPNNMTSNI